MAIEADPKASYLRQELAGLYLRQQKKAEALAVMAEVLKKSPEDVEALILYGRIQQSLNAPDPAAEAFETVLRLDPQRRNIYLLLGNLYLESGRLEDADRVYQQLVDLFPDAYAGHFFLGQIYARQNRRADAERALKQTLEIKPDLLQPRFELIELYRGKTDQPADNETIARLYQEVLSQDPDNIQAILGLGWLYHQTGRRNQARELFQDLGRHSLNNNQVVRLVAQLYLENKKFDAAKVILDGMLSAAPDNGNLHYLAGLASDGLKETETALYHFMRVPPESVFYPNAAVHIGFIYQEMGQLKKAIRFLEAVMVRFPENAEFPLYLGTFYEQLEDYKQAEAVLQKGLKIAPENPRLHFRLGVVYDKGGQKQRSIESMKTVIRLDPKHANALNYLGYTYADLGIHLTKAEAYIRRALEQSPDDGYITDSLGWVFYKKGEYHKSLAYLLKAVELVPDDPIILEHVGDVYQKLGEPEKALEFYRRSLEHKTSDQEELKKKIDGLQP
jgi:tetratricopeptide (TPR) repeat protein